MMSRGRAGAVSREEQVAWAGDINWRVTATLREVLFDALEVKDQTGVQLDVREVRSIDNSGVALLIGANHRAAALGRTLALTDHNGPVTTTLSALRLLRCFRVTQVLPTGGRSTERPSDSMSTSRVRGLSSPQGGNHAVVRA
jgi:anti-anti-sigma factor